MNRKRKCSDEIFPKKEAQKKERKLTEDSCCLIDTKHVATQPPAMASAMASAMPLLQINPADIHGVVYQSDHQFINDNLGVNTSWNDGRGSTTDAVYWPTSPVNYYSPGYYESSEYIAQGLHDNYYATTDIGAQNGCKQIIWPTNQKIDATPEPIKIEHAYYNQNITSAENYALQALLSLKDLQMVYN